MTNDLINIEPSSTKRPARNIVTRSDGKLINVARKTGQLFVCCKGCCCGLTDKGFKVVPEELYHEEWMRRKLRNKVHLTMGGCLGPCPLANVVLLLFDGQPIWFHSMTTNKQVLALYDYIEQMLDVQSYLPPPPALVQYHFNAFNWSLSALEKHDEAQRKEKKGSARLNEILFLTQADTDVLALSAAVPRLEQDFSRVYAHNIGYLSTDADIESFLKAKLPESGVVIVRLHRAASFMAGLRFLAKYAEGRDIWLVCVQGTDSPDPELTAFSNVDLATVNETAAYLQASGIDNYVNLLKFLSDHLLMTGFGYDQPKPQPRCGIYHPDVPEGTIEAWRKKANPAWPTAGLLFYRSHYLSGNIAFVDAIVREAERQHINVMPVYAYSLKDYGEDEGGSASFLPLALKHFVENGKPVVNALISTMSFALGSTERGSSDEGNWTAGAFQYLGVPVIQAINASISRDQWESSLRGLPPIDVGINIAIPEFDGRIISVPISFKETVNDSSPVQYVPDLERVARLVGQTRRLIALQLKANKDKRIAIILTNYNAKPGSIGNAVGLDAPASLLGLLNAMAERGYALSALPDTSDELLHSLIENGTYEKESLTYLQISDAAAHIPQDVYKKWFNALPGVIKKSVVEQWGDPPGKYYVDADDNLVLAGLEFGNAFVAVQPPRGYSMDPAAIYHATDLPTPHPYQALYSWLTRSQENGGWGADAIVHMGKHGTLEWLPGKGVGISSDCFPDALLGDLPLIYPFIVNDPGEGAQAKRRAHAVIIDHMTPPMTVAEGYDEIEELTQLVSEFYQMEKLDPDKLPALQRQIWDLIKKAKLDNDLGTLLNRDSNTHTHPWDPQVHEDGVPYTVSDLTGRDFAHLVENINAYLCELTSAQIRQGLHILGRPPEGQNLIDTLLAILRVPNLEVPSLRDAVGSAFGMDMGDVLNSLGARVQDGKTSSLEKLSGRPINTNAEVLKNVDDICEKLIQTMSASGFKASDIDLVVGTTIDWQNANTSARKEITGILRFVCDKLVPNLKRTTEEIDNLFVALNGKYVPPGPSGAPTRGMADVLPTGRNFYSLDPRGIPSSSAWEVGSALAASLIDKHLKDVGTYPQSVGISIWGTSVMRTFGDDVAEVLALLGVRPKWQSQSRRVTGIEVISLEELGRPRIDVVCRISGFFRDAFPDLISLMDEAFHTVAYLEEPADQNYVAAHFKAEKEALIKNGSTEKDAIISAGYRIFGSKPGSYGAGILPLINAGNWQNEADLAQTFLNWGGYAYTSGEFGTDARPQFARTLTNIRIAVKNQDNREHDIFDSDDYFQFHGGMIATIKALNGKSPLKYFGDSSNPGSPRVRDLKEEALRVFRSRVVNPKWITSIQRHGYKGAMELAATVDYIFGYDATSDVVDDWMYERLAQTYVLDPKMQEFFKQSNPWALKEILERLLEAVNRGLWKDPGELREELQWMYLSMNGKLEPGKTGVDLETKSES